MHPLDMTDLAARPRRRPLRRLLLPSAAAAAALLATGTAALARPHDAGAQPGPAAAERARAPVAAGAAVNGRAAVPQRLDATSPAGRPASPPPSPPPSQSGDRAGRRSVQVTLRDVQRQRIATVAISALGGGRNLVVVHARGLTPGFHAIHIHAVGVCDPAGAKPFASAGGHFNPTGQPEGMQAGAFPVLLANADGTAAVRFIDDGFQLGQLFGPTGAAIVIHSLPDNYANIPTRYATAGTAGPDAETMATGDAGVRVGCGVVAAPTAATSTPSMPMPMPMPSGGAHS